MKAVLVFVACLLFAARGVSAQETPEPTDWTIEQRCITAPSQPPEGWTYDGVIFTFKPRDGVHARRADVATPYYVAFDGNTEFAGAGSLSPDGQWLAVPVGQAIYSYNRYEYDFGIDEYRIYSTEPNRRVVSRVAVLGFIGSGASALHAATSLWLDDHSILLFGGLGSTSLYDLDNDVLTLEPTPPDWMDAVDLSYDAYEPFARHMQWTADGSYFAAKLAGEQVIGIFDRNGVLVDQLPLGNWLPQYSYSQDGRRLAFVEWGGSIHFADFETRTIVDTCIETWDSAAFSPDGKQLAFGLEPAGYVYILDIEAWQAYRIDLAAADVIGWYPLE